MNSSFFDFYPHTATEDAVVISHKDLPHELLSISDAALYRLVSESFKRLSFTFTRSHIEHLIQAVLSDNASDNDRYVCASLLKNAQCASSFDLPLCQDTGIAHIFSWIPPNVLLTDNARSIISKAVSDVYRDHNLRYSTTIPLNFYDEKDPRNNLPCQTFLFNEKLNPSFSDEAEPHASFLFCAKGGGSSNKTVFIQGTKADLTEEKFDALLKEKIKALGTSACPPYTIAVVAGGLSPEQNLMTLKLATCGCIIQNEHSFRDEKLEQRVMEIAEKAGYGAQFGGTKAAVEAVVIRLPRHGASCPISIGVSCSAHRNLKTFITKDGLYIEKTVTELSGIEGFSQAVSFADNKIDQVMHINTSSGINKLIQEISYLKPGTRLYLSGNILVARDAAHARWKKLIEDGKDLPDYAVRYPICYAGPSRTPTGFPLGSFGPTTAGRMDSYAEILMQRNAARITLAKGNRSSTWKEGCIKYNSCYLGTIGGAAALITSEYIVSAQVIDYHDLGMEAVHLVEVKNLPVFMLINGKGEDFYEQV
ncbi:MAG TPA: fumarate hydratase [Treponemataceae bacterium]|nr:fumarate hydratase [Treponemataceae bacterium]